MIPLAAPLTDAGNTQLVIAALLGIAAVVLLITAGEAAPVPRPDARVPP